MRAWDFPKSFLAWTGRPRRVPHRADSTSPSSQSVISFVLTHPQVQVILVAEKV